MKIRLNGEQREVEAGLTLKGLFDALGVGLNGTAVEVNREIVPKRLLAETPLNEGDLVEIVRMVGGG